MRSLIVAVVFSSILPLAGQAQAQAYRAINKLIVVPVNATDFEVIEARGEGARGLWCAAAEFAQARLGVPDGTRLYVKTPRGPARTATGRKGVVFTTSAKGLSPQSGASVSVRQVGYGLPQHHAYQFCKDYLIDLEDFF